MPRDEREAALVAGLIHDLRNPLAALAGNLALLREELDGVELSPTAAASLGDCEALATRALALIANLADVDALARGDIVVRPAPVRIAAEVERALATVDAEVATRELAVARDVPEALVAAADARLLGRVLGCLLDNAVRYAGRRGHISIRATEEDGQVVIAVGNSGPALTADERARVFEREFRVAERTAGARRGRGLGLYFCRLVAEAHGGSIAVTSQPQFPVEFVLRVPAR